MSTSLDDGASPPSGFTSNSNSICDQAVEEQANEFHNSSHELEYDLLHFLAAVQHCRRDFLPLSWHSEAHIGRGGYATVTESTVHADFSYAYRRVSKQKPGAQGDVKYDFAPAITELTILSHRPLENNDNIIKLEGVCWDVNPQKRQIAPVFVYKKMPHGDLHKFRDSREFEGLRIEEKLALCADIGKGLFALHSCGIIHGDIKPHNTLVEENRSLNTRFRAKISDFGSSQICRDDEDHEDEKSEKTLFCFPVTNGWTAPEHHCRGYDSRLAYGMDIYRFCLTCLWILLNGRVGAVTAKSTQKVIDDIRGAKDPSQAVLELVDKLQYGIAVTERLRRAFRSSLANEPDERKLTLSGIIRLFDTGWESARHELVYSTPPVRVTPSSVFKVSVSMFQLLQANYLVRELIFRCLKDKAASALLAPGPKPKLVKRRGRAAAFETAFCYHVGFGTRKNSDLALRIVHDSRVKKTLEDLEDEVEQVIHIYPFFNREFEYFINGGFEVHTDQTAEYLKEYKGYVIQEVIEKLVHASEDVSMAFSDLPQVGSVLKLTLGDLLYGTGAYHKAIPLYQELLDILPDDHAQSLTRTQQIERTLIMLHMINALRGAEKLTEAARLAEESLSMDAVRHTQASIRTKLALGSIYGDLGELNLAAEKLEDAYNEARQLLGETHQDSLRACVRWATALITIGRKADVDKAELELRRCLSISEKALEKTENQRRHEVSIACASRLATVIMLQGDQTREDEALKLMKEAVQSSADTRRPDDPRRLAVELELAAMYDYLGQLAKSKEGFAAAFEKHRRLYGLVNPDTLQTLDRLLDSLEEKEKEKLIREVVAGVDMTQFGRGFNSPSFTRFSHKWLKGKNEA